jgi:hypothetical protein
MQHIDRNHLGFSIVNLQPSRDREFTKDLFQSSNLEKISQHDQKHVISILDYRKTHIMCINRMTKHSQLVEED